MVTSATPAGAATVPGAPGKPVVYAMNGGVALQWSAPANVGSPPLTGYRVEVNNGSGWSAATPERRAVAIAAGSGHTCALLDGGAVKCWGLNQYGQLGLGSTANRGDAAGEMGDSLPAVALGTGRTAVAIAAGGFHTCALLDNHTVKCWGLNQYGQLGLGHTFTRGDKPGQTGDNLGAVALGPGRTALAIATGGDATCALLDNNTVKCWGLNDSGQLGLGDTANRGDAVGEMGGNLPAVALGTGRTAVAIATGGNHACAVLDNATVKCWGSNIAGQLGLGDSANRGDGPGEMGNSLPAVALGTGRTAIAIGVGSTHTCAVLSGHAVKCWGASGHGQLGIGEMGQRGDWPGEMGDSLPTVALGTGRTAFAIKLSSEHTCALLDGGRVKCWGLNNHGQLGLGDVSVRGDAPGEMGDNLPAVSLGTGRTAVAIATGAGDHTCVLFYDGAVKCWGFNQYGKLGLGDTVTRGAELLGDSLLPVALGTVNTVAVRTATVRLTRGTYQFRIVAVSPAGASTPSSASAPFALSAVPAAPTGLVGTSGDHRVSLTWSAPANDGGSAITNYEVTALTNSGEPTGGFGTSTKFVGSTATSFTFTGLLNGAGYKFRVAAINAVGAGAPVQLAEAVVPLSVPTAPRHVHVDAGLDRIVVYWSPPSQNGGSNITSYQVSVFNGSGGPATGVTGPTTRSVPVGGPGVPPYYFVFAFDGLTLGTVYTFRIAAVTALGTGAAAVTDAIAVGSPPAPTIVEIVSGSVGATTGSVLVTVEPAGDNGSPITGYTATCQPIYDRPGPVGSQTGASPLTVSGLSVGVGYTCAARATNARGTGGISAYFYAGIIGAPGAATEVTASSTAVHGELNVSFVAPDDHGSPITYYEVSCDADSGVYGYAEGAGSPVTVTGMTPGLWYRCQVRAFNARGGGRYSERSNYALT